MVGDYFLVTFESLPTKEIVIKFSLMKLRVNYKNTTVSIKKSTDKHMIHEIQLFLPTLALKAFFLL